METIGRGKKRKDKIIYGYKVDKKCYNIYNID